MPDKTRLAALNLTAERGDRRLFSELSFSVSAGETLQLIGENGAGKTTLLRMLAGLTRPAAGKVLRDEVPITADMQAHTGSLNWCGHRSGLKADLTVAENLAYATRLCGRSGEVDTALGRLGIQNLGNLPAGVLSAGQARRVVLARLLVRPAAIWLLDEPFTHLDNASAQIVAELIDDHTRNGGLCVLAAHELPTGVAPGWSTQKIGSLNAH